MEDQSAIKGKIKYKNGGGGGDETKNYSFLV